MLYVTNVMSTRFPDLLWGEDVTLVDLAVYIFVWLVTRGRSAQYHSQFNNLSEF